MKTLTWTSAGQDEPCVLHSLDLSLFQWRYTMLLVPSMWVLCRRIFPCTVQHLHSYIGTGLVNWRANPWQQNLPTQNYRKNRSYHSSLFQIDYDVHTFLHNSIATLQPVTITLLNRACAGARCESFSIATSRCSSSSSLSSRIRSFKTGRLGCCEEKESSSFSWLSKSLVSEETWIS